MTTARDIMTGLDRVGAQDTIETAAHKMDELHVDALPVCGPEGNVHTMAGMITEGAITEQVLGEGRDPATTRVGEVAQRDAGVILADQPVEEALASMTDHGIGRLPVTEGAKVVGVIDHATATKAATQPPDPH